ncbi:hypothetical protein BOTBODRAFT_191434 [Botryobasidium botryosum FD-172 SS1]|uniref:non-specific serine/threonine protein kinase n=1 Tax=Botryobasidium botryosum (strain FD-172 SS1) TaxID=930990 RepID=A0A067MAT7_BOTB1|nr:hypothetical protein BOTBODRAFT_191434 [Botryobasidium botryosum FD-172 SS1]
MVKEILQWRQRRLRLSKLISPPSSDDEDLWGTALDRFVVNGGPPSSVDKLCFSSRDVELIGTLADGQFGVVDVVRCRMDGQVYIRKSIQKRTAVKYREQCFPAHERELLLRARRSSSPWAPHLFCAFQTQSTLDLVMQYAEGGTLWDVLESATDARVRESDLKWWMAQAVCAIDWCHKQGFAHRDIKPHNFVLTPSSHLLLIDFGSAAPLLPPSSSGAQQIPKKYCLVPCGTCDYISPEILQASEEALVQADLGEDESVDDDNETKGGYGREVDWWSLGAMMYEMACGIAPFWARDVRSTYVKIVEHERSAIRFDSSLRLSSECQDLVRSFLTHADTRLGRNNVDEIRNHPFFKSTKWNTLHIQPAPAGLLLPQFTYFAPPPEPKSMAEDLEISQENSGVNNSADPSGCGFAFSEFFNSSVGEESSRSTGGQSPCPSQFPSASKVPTPGRALRRVEDDPSTNFVGFTWGPALDAFDHMPGPSRALSLTPPPSSTSLFAHIRPSFSSSVSRGTPLNPSSAANVPNLPSTLRPRIPNRVVSDPSPSGYGLSGYTSTAGGHFDSGHPYAHSKLFTPIRPASQTHLPNIASVLRTTTQTGSKKMTRDVSDMEALEQLITCVGASARKRVIESGKKPRYSNVVPGSGGFGFDRGGRSRGSSVRMEGGTFNERMKASGIPPLNMKRSIPSIHVEINSSLSIDSAPPSPSPRPGSSLSRRANTPTWSGVGRCTPTLTDGWTMTMNTISNSRVGRTPTPLGDPGDIAVNASGNTSGWVRMGRYPRHGSGAGAYDESIGAGLNLGLDGRAKKVAAATAPAVAVPSVVQAFAVTVPRSRPSEKRGPPSAPSSRPLSTSRMPPPSKSARTTPRPAEYTHAPRPPSRQAVVAGSRRSILMSDETFGEMERLHRRLMDDLTQMEEKFHRLRHI